MKNLTRIATILTSKKARLVIAILTVALFVLSAGAPNAMGGVENNTQL